MTTEQYAYWNLEPPTPNWYKNLQKAWKSNHRNGAERKTKESEASFSKFGEPEQMLRDSKSYLDYCLEKGLEPKAKVGRPKLPPEKLKQPKIKRSEQMRQLLLQHDIEVSEDNTLIHHPEYTFQPNGRVRRNDDAPISVHQFLKNLKI